MSDDAAFEADLAASVPAEGQRMLRARGMQLAANGALDEGISLIQRSIAVPGGDETVRNEARVTIADLRMFQGRPDDAESLLRETPGDAAALKLLELLLGRDDASTQPEVEALIAPLLEREPTSMTPTELFRFSVCMVRYCDRTADPEMRRAWAQNALGMAVDAPAQVRSWLETQAL